MKKHIPSVVSVMTPFPHSVQSGSPIAEARDMMRAHGIRHLPVTSAGELFGILSDREILVALTLGEERGDLEVGTICTTELYVVDRAARLDDVLAHMAEHHLEAALVVRKGKLVGILTSTDVYRFVGARLHLLRPEPPDVVA